MHYVAVCKLSIHLHFLISESAGPLASVWDSSPRACRPIMVPPSSTHRILLCLFDRGPGHCHGRWVCADFVRAPRSPMAFQKQCSNLVYLDGMHCNDRAIRPSCRRWRRTRQSTSRSFGICIAPTPSTRSAVTTSTSTSASLFMRQGKEGVRSSEGRRTSTMPATTCQEFRELRAHVGA